MNEASTSQTTQPAQGAAEAVDAPAETVHAVPGSGTAASTGLPPVVDQHGETLTTVSQRGPVLVVCLRHSGCLFCRQALADVSKSRQEIEALGTGIGLVHMMDDAEAEAMFEKYGLADVPRFSDPDRQLYAALDVPRGTPWQVAGPMMWWPAVKSMFRGHLPGVPKGDLLQLPGAVIVHNGEVVRRSVHATSGHRPNYVSLSDPSNESCDYGCT